jgi:hypothetical protein
MGHRSGQPIDKVEQRRLTGEYLVNYKLGDDIYTTRTSLDHDVWMLVSDDREWYVVAVCGNLAVAIPEYSLVLLVSFISSMNVPTPTKSSISMPSPAQEVIAFLSDRDYPHSSSNYWPQSLLELYTVSLADVQEQRVTTGLGLKKGNPMSSLVESLPESGRLEVDTKVTADVNISAYAARQKVNGFVLSDISYMMHAGDPTLVLAERIYWRVPVILSFTSRGDVGEVGAIDVDVETGQMHATPN